MKDTVEEALVDALLLMMEDPKLTDDGVRKTIACFISEFFLTASQVCEPCLGRPTIRESHSEISTLLS